MSVMIRLRRFGTKKKPFFRIVALDKREKPQGGYLDKIGHYDPRHDPEEIVIDRDKLRKWTDNGAQLSSTVSSLLKRWKKHDTSTEEKHPDERAEETPKRVEEHGTAQDENAADTDESEQEDTGNDRGK